MAKTYSDILNDPRWQQKRNEILERDDYKCKNPDCQYRDIKQPLNVHHIEYLDNFRNLPPWEYPNDMLLTLCDRCHAMEQARKEVEKQLLTFLKMKGFLLSDLLAFSTNISNDADFTKSLLKTLRNIQNG